MTLTEHDFNLPRGNIMVKRKSTGTVKAMKRYGATAKQIRSVRKKVAEGTKSKLIPKTTTRTKKN